MIKGLIFFASLYAASDGTAIGNIFSSWHQMGFFSYVLPFLIIFAFIFGILFKMNFFKDNNMINAMIALAVGLIAIQIPAVTNFFSIIFPNLGMALAVILVILIITGLFMAQIPDQNKKVINYILLGVAAIIVIVVLANTAGSLGWSGAQWWIDNWAMIVAVVIIVGLLIAMIIATTKSSTNP